MPAETAGVDAYLAGLEPGRRAALEQLRALVFATAPDAIKTMRYRLPTYELDGVLCSFASQKHYMSLYMDVRLVEKHKAELEHLDVGKSCIRFKRIEDLPLDTVRQILVETIASRRIAGDK